MKKSLLSAAVLSAATALSSAAYADFSLTVLHINDLHSRIESINKYDSTCDAESEAAGECFGGIARIKTKIDERRAALEADGKAVLTVDAGDQFQGSLFYTTYKGFAAVEFMNGMGFDMMAVGNHEFDDGPAALANFLSKAEFPILSGNIDVSADEALAGKIPGVLIVEKGGEQIALVSTLAEDTAETSSPGDDVRFLSAEDYLKGAVEGLEAAGINKIIAVTHMGLSRDKQIAATVPGIDLIVGGHSHTLLSNTQERASDVYPVMVENPDGQQVPIVQAYAYGKFLGEIEVTWDDAGNVVSASGEPILLDASVEPDAAFAARVAELAAPIEELKAKVIGSSDAAIDGDRGSCRAGECQMGNLVADAMLDRVKDQGIQIAIQNGGGLRASIDAGEVTMGEVLTVLPFQNTVATFQLKGSDVIAALENGVSKVEEGAGRFPQVAGLKYTWTQKKPAGEGRILLVEVMEDGAWTAIDPDKTYGVVSNNYMRGGGDGYSVFAEKGENAYDYGPGLEIVVADFIAAGDGYTPYTDGRITEQ
ncbi:multifunctional 2',3'-cyclic-nucleotide 2'-phosphodiesterase/5'-nucleotidase/3'-nucleotidase [Roseibium denhamense]|uniref:5'-nucleotidase n=1 Tax=Roseibium denhamense TaxID=76305 RepID=A0ABY1P5G1_9HYPH|nr:bifunctional metallophosphatase/5'-nucleotidase [Roseibium denhamense]MTI07168.1 multifunctional 2',3'-cyclic-nucleotide 2'-phosphodiesterase/5'-nucleotidase/3'-nucleotidase [Roseibium denhamense]SMP26774.1 5'-nucleotidase [Roseibium denhamense]